jgi:pimeloyl-ACP methyl ester carboxylesterase
MDIVLTAILLSRFGNSRIAACLLFAALSLCAEPSSVRVIHLPDGNACGITLPSHPSGKKAGLIVWFHGGMRSQNREKGIQAHRALIPFVNAGKYYLCSPSAFSGEDWLSTKGFAHAEALMDYMVSRYSIDTQDINLVGVSDGCLAVILYSLSGKRAINRRVLISSFPQLVLSPESLAGQSRFATGSWDFLQGGRDRLFPSAQVLPFLQAWEKIYPNARIHFFPEGEHDYSYYAENASNLLKSLF